MSRPLASLLLLLCAMFWGFAFIAQKTAMDSMGPLTFAARLWALGEILDIQAEVNASAAALDRPGLDLLNAEEEARIRELISLGTWPDGWEGTEPTADTPLDAVFADGSVQPLLIGAE